MTARRAWGRVLALGLVSVASAVPAVGLWAPARAQVTTTTTEAPAPLECENVPSRDDLTIRYCRPTDQTSKTSSFPLRVEVANTRNAVGGDPRVTEISVELVATLSDQELPEPATQTWRGEARSATISWTPTFTTNGPYDLRIRARGNGFGGQTTSATVQARLAAPPHAPTGVKAAKTSDGSVVVSWTSADREPDVLYYEVRRAAEGSSTFSLVDAVEAASTPRAVDDPGVGSWRYRVLAFRRGATADGPAIASSPGATSVEVAAPATTTTTEASSSGDGGSEGTPGGSTAGSTSTTRPAVTTGSRSAVPLRTITTTAGGRRTITTVRRVERDPGFQETLPFDLPAERPEAPPAEEATELGAGEDQAAGQDLIVDESGERRRSLGFVAGGLLLFVLGMTGLFVKGEVRRADELEALDPSPDPLVVPEDVPPAPAPAVLATPVVEPAPEEVPAPPANVADPMPAAALAAPAVATSRTRSRIPRRRSEAREARAVAAGAAPEAPEPEPTAVTAPAVGTAQATSRRRARAEARAQRAEELATMFGAAATDTADDERHLADLAAGLEPAVPPTRAIDRRVRRTVAPADAPDLDVPDPVAPAAIAARRSSPTTRTRTTDRARRAPTRLPSRPADDRREGGAAVRPRRRGTGQGDRRLPVG